MFTECLKVAQEDPEGLERQLFVGFLVTASDILVFLLAPSAVLGPDHHPLGLSPCDCPYLAPISLPID